MDWFAVRCIVQNVDAFEERITLWRAASAEVAIARAESEVAEYVQQWDGEATVLDLFQSYRLFEAPGDGREVFSLIRRSGLSATEYLDQFFDTGGELQMDAKPLPE